MAEITIVVPVYNVEKYVAKCIDSLLAQTFTDLEILLVNDGSTDGSAKICEEYARKDSRIKVIHQENQGLSAARNTGIEHASGKFLGFIDSDDYIDEDMYEVLYNQLQENQADISVCGIYNEYADVVRRACPTDEFMVVSQKEAMRLVLEANKISVNAVNKLYKKEIFQELRYPVGKLSEDAHVILEILLQAKTIVISTVPKYHYIHRGNSITTSPYKSGDLSVIEAYSKNKRIIEKYYPDLLEVAEFRCFFSYFYVLDKMALSKEFKAKNERKEVIKLVRNNIDKILHNHYVGRNRKLAARVLLIHPFMYNVFVKIEFRRKRKNIN